MPAVFKPKLFSNQPNSPLQALIRLSRISAEFLSQPARSPKNTAEGYTLQRRRTRGELIETYKLLSGKEGISSTQFFQLSANEHGLGAHKKKFASAGQD